MLYIFAFSLRFVSCSRSIQYTIQYKICNTHNVSWQNWRRVQSLEEHERVKKQQQNNMFLNYVWMNWLTLRCGTAFQICGAAYNWKRDNLLMSIGWRFCYMLTCETAVILAVVGEIDVLYCLGGCIGLALDSWSKGRWFDSRPGRYQVN